MCIVLPLPYLLKCLSNFLTLPYLLECLSNVLTPSYLLKCLSIVLTPPYLLKCLSIVLTLPNPGLYCLVLNSLARKWLKLHILGSQRVNDSVRGDNGMQWFRGAWNKLLWNCMFHTNLSFNIVVLIGYPSPYPMDTEVTSLHAPSPYPAFSTWRCRRDTRHEEVFQCRPRVTFQTAAIAALWLDNICLHDTL